MKIGVDLDGVIFDSEKIFRVQAELYDIMTLNRNSIIDNREVKFQDRYKWSKEELYDFIEKQETKIIKEAPLMPGAKEVLKLLKKEGHELVIITARGGRKKEYIEMSKDILKNNDIYIFTDYFWGVENKGEICKQEKVELMIDDSDKKCKAISKIRNKNDIF